MEKKKKINVVFVTQDDPFYLPHFFNEFSKISFDDDINVFGVIILDPLGEKNLKNLVKRMYSFYGLFNFIKVGIRYTLYKVTGILAVKFFRGKFPGIYSVRHCLMKNEFNILEIDDINSSKAIECVIKNDIDLIVSVGGSQKFKKPILKAPTYGCINVHNAKLPKNRGMLPSFWAMLQYEMDSTTAMTVFQMDEELDSGDIILQEEVKLYPESESLDELIVRMKKKNAKLIFDAIKMFKNGLPKKYPNDDNEATYFSFPSREDVKKFQSKGYRLI